MRYCKDAALEMFFFSFNSKKNRFISTCQITLNDRFCLMTSVLLSVGPFIFPLKPSSNPPVSYLRTVSIESFGKDRKSGNLPNMTTSRSTHTWNHSSFSRFSSSIQSQSQHVCSAPRKLCVHAAVANYKEAGRDLQSERRRGSEEESRADSCYRQRAPSSLEVLWIIEDRFRPFLRQEG